MKVALPGEDYTVIMTSCGRWELLLASVESFLAHHRPERFVIVEDSADHDFAARLARRFPNVEVLLNDPRLGQHRSIDRAYGAVVTPFVVHLEDDWMFTGPANIVAARSLLDTDEKVAAVCFSAFRRLKLRHRLRSAGFEHAGQLYRDMRGAHRESYGYSFYPTLVRHRTWREHGPFALYPNERALSRHMKKLGFVVVHEEPGIGVHTGSGQRAFDPTRKGEPRYDGKPWWRRFIR